MSDLRQPWKVSDVLSGPNVQGVRYVNVVDAYGHLIGCVDSRVAAKVCAVEELIEALFGLIDSHDYATRRREHAIATFDKVNWASECQETCERECLAAKSKSET